MQVISPTERKFEKTEFQPYIESFKLESAQVEILLLKRQKCHLERPWLPLFLLFQTQEHLSRMLPQFNLHHSYRGKVSDETINGRRFTGGS